MQIQFATKKVDGAYEAALIVDGKFARSGGGRSITDLFVKLCGPLLSQDAGEGAEVAVNVAILTAVEVARVEASEKRKQDTQVAAREAEEIEALTAAVNREKAAREAGTKAVGA